jgi:hypothetical protein
MTYTYCLMLHDTEDLTSMTLKWSNHEEELAELEGKLLYFFRKGGNSRYQTEIREMETIDNGIEEY